MSEAKQDRQWLTLREVAERWGVSYDTLNREVNAGKIPVLKIRSERRISIKFIERMESAAEQAEIKKTLKIARRGAYATAGKDYYPDC